MGLTWIAIAASLLMGSAGLLIFIWSVRSHMFRDFEDVKYQVFWSDRDEETGTTPKNAIPKNATEEQQHGSSTKDERAR
jgi:cbb3-type cytochrome oxidase maturation protein